MFRCSSKEMDWSAEPFVGMLCFGRSVRATQDVTMRGRKSTDWIALHEGHPGGALPLKDVIYTQRLFLHTKKAFCAE